MLWFPNFAEDLPSIHDIAYTSQEYLNCGNLTEAGQSLITITDGQWRSRKMDALKPDTTVSIYWHRGLQNSSVSIRHILYLFVNCNHNIHCTSTIICSLVGYMQPNGLLHGFLGIFPLKIVLLETVDNKMCGLLRITSALPLKIHLAVKSFNVIFSPGRHVTVWVEMSVCHHFGSDRYISTTTWFT